MNILPALSTSQQTNMSAEEFQNQLCIWLQDKGLLCELKNYFRANMIEIFNNTPFGSSIRSKIKLTSPKLQAMNLLVSEFLVYSQYHYSLCVFCTEASVINIFPDVIKNRCVNAGGQYEKQWKFSKQETCDILESLGIVKSEDVYSIYTTYYESRDESLLTCIIKAKANVKNTRHQTNNVDSFELAVSNINKLLMDSNLSSDCVSQIQYHIKFFCDKQSEKNLLTEKLVRDEYKNELNKCKETISNIKNSFHDERKQLQSELLQLQQIIQSHNGLDKDKITKLKTQSSKQVQTENSGNLETLNLKTINDALEDKYQLNGAQKLNVFQDPAEDVNYKQQLYAKANRKDVPLKRLVKQLQMENNYLRNQNLIYFQQIQELGKKADRLLCELETSKRKISSKDWLRCHSSKKIAWNVDEKCLHSTHARQCYDFEENNCSSPSFALHDVNTTERTNITDEVLHEARGKLMMLEMESNNIDRNIYCADIEKKSGNVTICDPFY